MNFIKTVAELCELTGLKKERVLKILEVGIKCGGIKKISETEYEMTDMGKVIGDKLRYGYAEDPGVWKCSKCKTMNHVQNGPKCLKCDYSFMDSMASNVMNKENRDYKFPEVTDREMLIFLTGNITGMSAALPSPKGMSFSEQMELTNHIARVSSIVMTKVKDQFPIVTDEEFNEIILQLNALKSMPILKDAMKAIWDMKP